MTNRFLHVNPRQWTRHSKLTVSLPKWPIFSFPSQINGTESSRITWQIPVPKPVGLLHQLSLPPPLSIPHIFINQACYWSLWSIRPCILLQAKSPIVRDSCRFVNDCKIHGKIRHKCLRKYIYLGYCKVMKVNFTVLK